jgi:hypothetical protein
MQADASIPGLLRLLDSIGEWSGAGHGEFLGKGIVDHSMLGTLRRNS